MLIFLISYRFNHFSELTLTYRVTVLYVVYHIAFSEDAILEFIKIQKHLISDRFAVFFMK